LRGYDAIALGGLRVALFGALEIIDMKCLYSVPLATSQYILREYIYILIKEFRKVLRINFILIQSIMLLKECDNAYNCVLLHRVNYKD
jgi:hypothetical protein